jgi:hypothetical protein
MLGVMADDDHNPYAPPAEPLDQVRAFRDDRDDGPNDFESERRPVILTIILTVVTLGFYPSIWLLKRRAFLDRQDTGKELGTGLPMFVLVSSIIGVGLAFGGAEAAKIRPLFTLAGGIATLIANFRVLGILRSVSSRTGRFLEFSTMGTFFFGVYYLQYKINQMADTPARAERPRRKKKKRKKADALLEMPVDAAEADAEAELRVEEEARQLRTSDPPPAP